MNCSVPPCYKKGFMCVFDVCVCVWCLCVGGGGGGVMCLLLLMSHDFPVLTTLQNVSVLASEMRNECLFFTLVTHVVKISQQGGKISLAEVKCNFFGVDLKNFWSCWTRLAIGYYIIQNTALKIRWVLVKQLKIFFDLDIYFSLESFESEGRKEDKILEQTFFFAV